MLTSSMPANARTSAEAAPRLSFITPAYNAIATLDQTIASVCAQTCPDWEMFVIDDGSKDSTFARAREWAARDRRITALTKPNGGPASARNLGIGLARGTWLAFLDSDDWLRPTYVERLLREADRSPNCGLVTCAYDTVTADGRRLQTHWARDLSDPYPVFARMCPVAPVGLIVRADLIRALGGFDESLIGSEDWDMWQRVARMGVRFATVADSQAYYRLLPNSLSRKAKRLVVDGMAIIDRGFSRDERRADGDDPYADGCDPSQRADAKAHYGLFIASVATGGDIDPAEILAHAPDMARWTFDPEAWGEVIADALAYAMTFSRSDLSAHWEIVKPKLDRLLDALAVKMGPCRQVDLLRVHTYARISGFEAARAAAVAPIAVALIDIADPIAPLSADDDAIMVVGVTAGGAILDWRTVLPCEVTNAEAVRDWLRTVMPRLPVRRAVRAARVLRRPAFWRDAIARMAAPDAIASVFDSDSRAGLTQRVKRSALAAGQRGLVAAIAGEPPIVRPRPSRSAPILPILRMRAFVEGDGRYRLSEDAVRTLLENLQRGHRRCISLAEAAQAQRAWSAPPRGAYAIAIDAAGIAPTSGLFALLRAHGAKATIFATRAALGGAWSSSALDQLRAQGFEVGFACDGDATLSRRPARDVQAYFADALEAVGGELGVSGVQFAVGDVDDVIRRTARAAGFGFGVGPVSGFANMNDDPMDWCAFDALACESTSMLMQKIEPTLS